MHVKQADYANTSHDCLILNPNYFIFDGLVWNLHHDIQM